MSFRALRIAMMAAVISALMATPALADSGWFWQNPLPQGNQLFATAAVDTNVVVAVGAHGTILRTTAPRGRTLCVGIGRRVRAGVVSRGFP
jgi:hypothetical protein